MQTQPPQPTSILHDIDSIDYGAGTISVVPTLDLNFLQGSIKDPKDSPKGMKSPMDADMGMPTPKRLKSDSKTPFVSCVDKADKKIRQHIIETPLVKNEVISQKVGSTVYFKYENDQISGSFKARGAFNKVILERERFKKGGLPVFITASTGNHAYSMIKAISTFGMECQILLPYSINNNKLDRLKEYLDQSKVTIRFFGNNCLQTELEARNEAMTNNLIYVSPYNDIEVIYGHGTIAPELIRQMKKYDKKIDYVIVPVGGGGLISGIATYFKEVSLYYQDDVKIVGVSPQNDCSLIDCLRDEVKEYHKSFSDETSGGVEMDSLTFSFCKKYVDDWVTVSEEEIEYAAWEMIQQNKMIEGSGVLGLAALYKEKEKYDKKNVVVVLSGGNIGMDNLVYLLEKYQKSLMNKNKCPLK